jgi:hypothetical protein
MELKHWFQEQSTHLTTLKSELDVVLGILSQENYDEQIVVKEFLKLLEKYPCNAIIVKHFLDFLRISNSPEVYTSFDNKDLRLVYEQLLLLNPWDIDSATEYYFYLKIFLDESEEADKVLYRIKELIKIKQKEWKKYS